MPLLTRVRITSAIWVCNGMGAERSMMNSVSEIATAIPSAVVVSVSIILTTRNASVDIVACVTYVHNCTWTYVNKRLRMRVAVVGSYGVGETMLTKRFPGPGETVTEGILSVGHGGKGSNQAVATRRLGAEVSLLTAVGEDAAAEAAIDLWRREGIDASQVLKVEGAKTMTGMIIVDDEAENRIVIAPGALDHLRAADVRERSELIES